MLNTLVNKLTTFINPILKKLDNPLIMGMMSVFIVLYGALAKPELPNFMKNMMQSDIFRVFYIFLIAYTGDKNLIVSIVIAFGFMVMFGLLVEIEVQESFENTDITEALEGQLDKLLEDLDDSKKAEGTDDVEKEDVETEENA